jgi:photosystem II stability/assembly factor-like uncharacterized protein
MLIVALIGLSGCVSGAHVDVAPRTHTQVGPNSPGRHVARAATQLPRSNRARRVDQAGGCASLPRWATRRQLLAVQFVSASTGWVLGRDRILATRDGGRHWLTQYRTTTSAGLDAIDFIDARHGWAVGTHVVLTTRDGGRHWHRESSLCHGLRSVDFVSPTTGYGVAVGGDDISGDGAEMNDIPMYRGRLVTTTDAGRHWHGVPAPRNVQTACFATPTAGWVGAGGAIYATHNAGGTWSMQRTGRPRERMYMDAADVRCQRGRMQAWAQVIGGAAMSKEAHIGYHYNHDRWRALFAERFFTDPAVTVTRDAPGSYPSAIAPISGRRAVFLDWCPVCMPHAPGLSHTWQAGSVPFLIAADGGTRLGPVATIAPLSQVAAAAFVTGDQGWVVGTQQRLHHIGRHITRTTVDKIVHTSDGGRTWRTQLQFRSPQ